MTSFARSGETVLLRTLNAHPKITVAHQIIEFDTALANRLVYKVSTRNIKKIRVPFEIWKPGSTHLLVKHAVWTHKYPHRGFTFVRNPFSIIASLKRYSIENDEDETFRRQRIGEWAHGIDGKLIEQISPIPEVEALSRLYLAKMTAALDTGHPVFRYEDFTTDPRSVLQGIVDALGLCWDENLMSAETAYPTGLKGHGGIDLSRPIQIGIPAYAGGLSEAEIEVVASITKPVLEKLDYSRPAA